MRKHFMFIVALICAAFSFSSCKKDKATKVEAKDSITISNFNDVLAKDFKSIKDSNVVFYESQIILKEPVTADTTLEIAQVTNVFQAGEYCYQFIHHGDTTRAIKVHDWWLEDVRIDIDKIITLDSALIRLNQADIVKPKSNFITLRCPLGPKVYNPGYFVGSANRGFVKVDAITADVTSVK